MLTPHPDYKPTAYDDDFEDIPTPGPVPMWLGGILIPLAHIAYGLSCLITRHGVLPGNRASMELTGSNAIALGLATMSIGLFLHTHYFWGNLYHLAAWAVAGKIVSLITLIASLGYLLVHVGVLGRM